MGLKDKSRKIHLGVIILIEISDVVKLTLGNSVQERADK